MTLRKILLGFKVGEGIVLSLTAFGVKRGRQYLVQKEDGDADIIISELKE